MKTRLFLTIVFCGALCALTLSPQSVDAKELGIGSQAPPLDIEHWVQDGNGFFQQVTEFTPGKVYVVEFWATWCGPCIQSMPHLAEMQNEYRGRGVQIVSVSDEGLDEVNGLLAQQNEQVGKTFSEITAAYSLTTDPDRSVHVDYMEASNQPGIPTAFIVGKSGLIEWIGHPMEMDEPLEAVVTDGWDREKFKKDFDAKQQFDRNMQQLQMLAGAGKFNDAIELADSQIASVESEEQRAQWVSIRYSLKLSAGQVDEEVLTFFRGQLKEMKGDAYAIGRFGYQLFGVIQQGGEIGVLGDDVVKSMEAEIDGAEDQLKPLLYNTIALLSDATGNTEKAIKAQQAAIETADERQKDRLIPFLEELKEKAGQTEADSE
jgi:thiol-disulfide isomerase/thioredoxin